MGTLRVPRFWDLHLHGVAGVDFMFADDDQMAHACEVLGMHGTGWFAPTLLTSEPRLLEEACSRWGAFLTRAQKPRFLPPHYARPIGLHLEGPFLSPKMAGAHPKSYLKKPSLSLANKLIKKSEGHVSIITVAPELPGAARLIRSLSEAGVRIQLGHSVADSSTVSGALRSGARGLTHLYNAMRIHHREPGLLSALSDQRVTAEIIADGIHLSSSFVRWCMNAAPSQLYAVSDGCSAIAAPKGAPLTLGSLTLRKQGRMATTRDGILAGGATFLAEHPGSLWKSLNRNSYSAPVPAQKILELFYAIQCDLFSRANQKWKAHTRQCNHFDKSTLAFFCCED